MIVHTIVLASASPQRKTLLEGLGLTFEVVPSAVDERSCAETDPVRRARVLATLKAREVAGRRPDAWVIGCDTLVVAADGTLLEKPADPDDARRMIRLQGSRTSVVHSGLTLIAPDGREHEGVSSSNVTFAELTDQDIEWWIRSGNWKDRSGSFQIDGQGQLLISRIEGDWTSVVGFPVFLFGRLCSEAELKIN